MAVTRLGPGGYPIAALQSGTSHAKTINISLSELLTLNRSTAKSIPVLLSESVLLARSIFKTILLNSPDILTLSTAVTRTILQAISLLTGELLTVTTPQINKTILLYSSELIIRGSAYFKTIILTTQNLLGLIAVPPIQTKIISLFQSQLLTISGGPGKLFFKTINFVTSQFLRIIEQYLVSREAIKLIPLDFSYHFLSTPETLYINDSATMFMTPSQPKNAISRLALKITSPSGLLEIRSYPDIWIGPVPSWSQTDPNGITQFLVTQFTRNSLDEAGVWLVSVLDNGAAIYSSQFTVSIKP